MEADEGATPREGGIEPPVPAQRISRAVPLPTGRAVIGALLVTFAVVGLFSSYRRSQAASGTDYVVVSHTVPAGAVIEPEHLTLRELDLGEIGDRTLTEPSAAVGSVAIQTLVPGQLVQRANILDASSGAADDSAAVEVSFAIPRARALNGNLSTGETVDVVATIDQDGDTCSLVVAPRAQVVCVRGGTDAVISSERDLTVTLALTEDSSVLRLIFAADEADLTIVRATRAQGTTIQGSFCGPSVMTDTREARS